MATISTYSSVLRNAYLHLYGKYAMNLVKGVLFKYENLFIDGDTTSCYCRVADTGELYAPATNMDDEKVKQKIAHIIISVITKTLGKPLGNIEDIYDKMIDLSYSDCYNPTFDKGTKQKVSLKELLCLHDILNGKKKIDEINAIYGSELVTAIIGKPTDPFLVEKRKILSDSILSIRDEHAKKANDINDRKVRAIRKLETYFRNEQQKLKVEYAAKEKALNDEYNSSFNDF